MSFLDKKSMKIKPSIEVFCDKKEYFFLPLGILKRHYMTDTEFYFFLYIFFGEKFTLFLIFLLESFFV